MRTFFLLLTCLVVTSILAGCGTSDPLDRLATITTDESAQTGADISQELQTESDSILDAQTETEQGGGTYTTYTEDAFLEAQKEKKRIVLYFHDDESVTCTTFKKNASRYEARIPADVVILEIQFPTETSLTKTYDVTKSNTFVFLDATGKETKRMHTGILKLEEILTSL